MSTLNVQKVGVPEDRSLPIFAEFEKFSDRLRVQAYNLFSKRGGTGEQALDDWLTAERDNCWPAAAELAERNGVYTLSVALAGFDAKEIEVTATPNEVIVKASHEVKEGSAESETELRWSEFRNSSVFRRIEFPVAVDTAKVSAKFENGLLSVRAPQEKASSKAVQKIEISAPS